MRRGTTILATLLAASAVLVASAAPASADTPPNPFGEPVTMTPEPTVLRVGGPGLVAVTMTFAVRAHFTADGSPAVGEEILFTQKNVARGASGHPEMDPNYVRPVEICTAVVDATGLATCRGSAATSSLVALLLEKSYANHELFPSYESVKLPPFKIG